MFGIKVSLAINCIYGFRHFVERKSQSRNRKCEFQNSAAYWLRAKRGWLCPSLKNSTKADFRHVTTRVFFVVEIYRLILRHELCSANDSRLNTRSCEKSDFGGGNICPVAVRKSSPRASRGIKNLIEPADPPPPVLQSHRCYNKHRVASGRDRVVIGWRWCCGGGVIDHIEIYWGGGWNWRRELMLGRCSESQFIGGGAVESRAAPRHTTIAKAIKHF